MASILFRDAPAAQDLLGFAGRITPVEDGLVRLKAKDGVLAISASALSGGTLLEERPTVLAMRFAAVDPELQCDLVVSAAGLAADPDPLRVTLPETASSAAWAGSPHRSAAGSGTERWRPPTWRGARSGESHRSRSRCRPCREPTSSTRCGGRSGASPMPNSPVSRVVWLSPRTRSGSSEATRTPPSSAPVRGHGSRSAAATSISRSTVRSGLTSVRATGAA